jgi:hypothetical protein
MRIATLSVSYSSQTCPRRRQYPGRKVLTGSSCSYVWLPTVHGALLPASPLAPMLVLPRVVTYL